MSQETHEERASNLHRLSERERQDRSSGGARDEESRQSRNSSPSAKTLSSAIFKASSARTGAKDRLELAVLALSEISSAA